MRYPFDDCSDEDLVRLAQSQAEAPAGREAAACLLQRHTRRVYVWCHRYANGEDEARDLAQDVLVLAYTRLATFSHRSRFTSWLFILARHRCLTHVRRRKPPFTSEVDLDALPSHDPDPEQRLLEQLGEDALRRTVCDALDPAEQDAIWLRSVERMSIDGITAVLGLRNASGARALLQRARRKLRAALEAADESA